MLANDKKIKRKEKRTLGNWEVCQFIFWFISWYYVICDPVHLKAL